MSLANKMITISDFNKIVDLAINRGMDVDIFEGVLVDSAIIETGNVRLLKNSPKSKYIILKEKYLNSWSSGIQLTFTNSEKKAEEFKKNMS